MVLIGKFILARFSGEASNKEGHVFPMRAIVLTFAAGFLTALQHVQNA